MRNKKCAQIFFFLLVKKYFGIKPDLIQDHEKKLFQNAISKKKKSEWFN